MTQTADLHFHSTYSDGKHSIEWLLQHLKPAFQEGLGLAVLTDHDMIEGFPEFSEGIKKWCHPLCASELSCTFTLREKNMELHLLAYGLDPKDEEMKIKFKNFKEHRKQRFYKICEKLKEAGYPLDSQTLAEKHHGVLGRPHVADALVEIGAAQNRQEAFDKFLHDGSPYVISKWRFPLEDAVKDARKKGYKTSIAHPGSYGFKEDTLKVFRELGVNAIEVYHPRHTSADVEYYEQCAKRLGFFISGGSDFHDATTDLWNRQPSIGHTSYSVSLAQKFLSDFL